MKDVFLLSNSLGYAQIKDLSVGDVFFEDGGYGVIFRCVVTEAPVETCDNDLERRQLAWKDEVVAYRDSNVSEGEHISDSNVVDYLITEGLTHYGPRIYSGITKWTP